MYEHVEHLCLNDALIITNSQCVQTFTKVGEISVNILFQYYVYYLFVIKFNITYFKMTALNK